MEGFRTSGEKSTGDIEEVRNPDKLLTALFVDMLATGEAMMKDSAAIDRLKASGEPSHVGKLHTTQFTRLVLPF